MMARANSILKYIKIYLNTLQNWNENLPPDIRRRQVDYGNIHLLLARVLKVLNLLTPKPLQKLSLSFSPFGSSVSVFVRSKVLRASKSWYSLSKGFSAAVS